MIHDFSGNPSPNMRSPRVMRKQSRPLSIIDENLEDWTRGGHGNDTNNEVEESREVEASVKSTDDSGIECKGDDSGSISQSSQDQASSSSLTEGTISDASEDSTETAPADDRRRRNSLRRVAVAPLKHPVFALIQDEMSENVQYSHNGVGDMTSQSSDTQENHINIVQNDLSMNQFCQDASPVASEIKEHAQDHSLSGEDSDHDLDIGYGLAGVQNQQALTQHGHVQREGSSFAKDFSNSRVPVFHSSANEQFTDASDSDEGYSDVHSESERTHNVFKEKSLEEGKNRHEMKEDSVFQASNMDGGFSVSTESGRNNFKVTQNAEGCIGNHDNVLDNILREKKDPKVSFHTDKRNALDKEQLAWKNRVRQSFSFTALSNKFRPLRRSVSSFDSKMSPPADTERSGERLRTYSDTVRFYNPDGSPTLQRKGVSSAEVTGDEHIKEGSSSPRWQRSAKTPPRIRKYSWHDFRSVDKGYDTTSPPSIRRTSLDHTKLLISAARLDSFAIRTKLRDEPHQSGAHSLPQNNQPVESALTNENDNRSDSQSNAPPIRRISAIDQSDFSLLKATATRLNLPTRRPSTMAWRARYVDNQAHLPHPSGLSDSEENNNVEKAEPSKSEAELPLTTERKNKINESLSWLRQELISIRLQDQDLARQFLGIRHTMNKLRLAAECEGHKALLDNAEEDMEELRELSRLVDIPTELLSPLPTLQHLGVTRMNITSRRFSTC